jgi:putative hemolysin
VYPVAHDELDHIEGVVYLKDLFSHLDEPDFKLADILRPAQFFPENQSVYNTLEHLKSDHIKYGLVTDEFGSIQGIVTLKDIVDVLLGEITESHDEPEIIRRDDGSLLVDGQCSFYEFLEYIDMECLYPEYDYNTISGLILHLLEHIPHTGEKISWHELEFEIVDMDGARIDKILVYSKQ